MKKIICLVLILSSFIYSCKKDEKSGSPASNALYNYFPVNVGHETIYDASLITKDEFTEEEDTVYYQIKELIESAFYDNQGRLTQRIERYHRNTPMDPWVIHDVWTSNITAAMAEKKEDNFTYVKLIFPVSEGRTWNGNSLNTLDAEEYEYTSVNTADIVGGSAFDSVATVIQLDDDNFISKDYNLEKYAYGVGLIYRENTHIDKNYDNPNVPGVKAQRLYKETIISWSN
jgi:hypothetical protein